MTGARSPNPKQQELASLPIGNVLVIAPAGCGKTEALAFRAKAVLARGDVAPPRKVLALTYSNKAKDNLASRMRQIVGPSWRERVTVTNFHGMSARLIRAHGRLLGIFAEVVFPEASWRQRRLRELGIDWQNSDAFEAALRAAKDGVFDDDEVMSRLKDAGHRAAIAYEQSLRDEQRLDYDDLIRHAGRLLLIPAVVRLYQSHFAMVMVDEVQDLSLHQYEIARGVGGDKVTYAGDPAQGIYSFAGAQPEEVFRRIRALVPAVVDFATSYRSAPAVLDAVNALASEMDSTVLESGNPDRWPDRGHVIVMEREDTQTEGADLVRLIQRLLKSGKVSVGVIGRRSTRMDHLRAAADAAGIPFEDWSSPIHVPKVVQLLKGNVRRVLGAELNAPVAIDRLEELCRSDVEPSDAETLDEIASACDALRDLVEQGKTVEQAVASCREAVATDVPVCPGLHFVTGHRGKGQEFDWVFVLGLEEGHVPDFRTDTAESMSEELRVLHVMVSRASYGLVVTYSRQTMTKAGWWARGPSPWLDHLRRVGTSTV